MALNRTFISPLIRHRDHCGKKECGGEMMRKRIWNAGFWDPWLQAAVAAYTGPQITRSTNTAHIREY